MENKDIISKNLDKYMNIALDEAKKAYKKNEVPIGAVIISSDGKILAKAYNRVEKKQNATLHAEMLAISKACKKTKQKYLMDCSIFITLEPCPMCAMAISLAKIKNIYIGAVDKKGGAVLNNIKIFSNMNNLYKPNINVGILKNESERLLKDFFKNLRKK